MVYSTLVTEIIIQARKDGYIKLQHSLFIIICKRYSAIRHEFRHSHHTVQAIKASMMQAPYCISLLVTNKASSEKQAPINNLGQSIKARMEQ